MPVEEPIWVILRSSWRDNPTSYDDPYRCDEEWNGF